MVTLLLVILIIWTILTIAVCVGAVLKGENPFEVLCFMAIIWCLIVITLAITAEVTKSNLC